MHYLEFMRALHERLEPRTYLEIGVAEGHSLALSRCPSIGIDPAFCVDQQLVAPVSLLRCTSDEFFARLGAQRAQPFAEFPIDLGYVDGMHHFEFALRDFIGLERYAAASSVIAFDDVLPRNQEEATRDPTAWPWTGDVFRVPYALAEHRPDLLQVCVDTEPTGTLLVAKLDPANEVLPERLDDIIRDYVQPDPQPIPDEILDRANAIAPTEALELELWDELRDQRHRGNGTAGMSA